MPSQTRPKVGVQGSFHLLARSFERSLAAENKSVHTIRAYTSAIRYFGDFLVERGMPVNIEAITREHVQEYLAEVVRTKSANTASNRHRSLKIFFTWLVSEEELRESPFKNMKAPHVPEQPPGVLDDEALR